MAIPTYKNIEQLLKFDSLCRDACTTHRNTSEEIIERMTDAGFKVSKSTIYAYRQQFIELWGAKFKKVGRRVLFEYVDRNQPVPGFSKIVEQAKSDVGAEMLSLLEASDSLDSAHIWMKLFLRAMLKGYENSLAAVSFYESMELNEVRENFETVLDYILRHQPIEIKQSGAKRPIARIHPYLLKNYNGRWFLIGKTLNPEPRPEHPDEYYEDYSATPLHSIESIEPWNTKFIDPDMEDIQEYFDEFVGVTPDREHGAQKVYLRFDPLRYQKYVSTKPLSGSQKLVSKDSPYYDADKPVVELDIHCNRELVQQILSFGPDCEVLAPASLRQRVADAVMIMAGYYLK